jgi:hypothetical protein
MYQSSISTKVIGTTVGTGVERLLYSGPSVEPYLRFILHAFFVEWASDCARGEKSNDLCVDDKFGKCSTGATSEGAYTFDVSEFEGLKTRRQ